jgi:hypothetical protein
MMATVWEIRIKGEMFPVRCYYEEDVQKMVDYYTKLGKIKSEEDYTISTRKLKEDPRWELYSNDREWEEY